MNRFYLADVTAQGTAVEAFYDLEIKTSVSQCTGKFSAGSGKARKAQLNFAPGFFASPVDSERLIVVEIGPALYAIGGNTPDIQEALAIQPGERLIVSTDANGTAKAIIRAKADGSVNINNGNLEVL